jgi:hypothetical protein
MKIKQNLLACKPRKNIGPANLKPISTAGERALAATTRTIFKLYY